MSDVKRKLNQGKPFLSRLFDWLSFGFAWSCAVIVFSLFVLLVFKTLAEGVGQISWSFLTEEPLSAGREGGISTIIESTFWIIVVCMAVSVPLGLGTAIWMAQSSDSNEKVFGIPKYRMIGMVRQSLNVLAGVPSIVFGLFGSAFFCYALGLGYSILSGGLTLACMVLPIFIRVTEEGIRAVPNEYRFGAASLGLSRTTTLLTLVLPTAGPTIAAGLVLGIGRALAETAALIFTSGYVTKSPSSLYDSGRSLSVHIYEMAMNVPGGNGRAFATAAVLVVMLLVINMVAIGLTRLATGKVKIKNALRKTVQMTRGNSH